MFSLGITTNGSYPRGLSSPGGESVVSRNTDSPSVYNNGGTASRHGGWLAVGLESSEVEVVAIGPDGPACSGSVTPDEHSGGAGGGGGAVSPATNASLQHFRLTRHQSCVLALRFAHHGNWFLTTGKDHQVNAWRTPYGACLLEVGLVWVHVVTSPTSSLR